MKELIQTTAKQLLADRMLLALLAAITIGAVTYVLMTALRVQPTDLQLAVRYTSFGETQYYRERWFYLIGFGLFGLIFLVGHLAIIAKLYVTGMRHLAYAFAWLSLIVLGMMFVYAYLVLGIAYLS